MRITLMWVTSLLLLCWPFLMPSTIKAQVYNLEENSNIHKWRSICPKKNNHLSKSFSLPLALSICVGLVGSPSEFCYSPVITNSFGKICNNDAIFYIFPVPKSVPGWPCNCFRFSNFLELFNVVIQICYIFRGLWIVNIQKSQCHCK